MAANTYGSLPITIKTTTIVQNGLTQRIVETLHESASVPVVAINSVVSGLRVTSVQNDPETAGIVKQTVTYEGTTTSDLPTLPATTYESQGSMVELPIQQHPDWATTLKADWDEAKGEFKPTSAFYGMTSYIVGSVSVTRTEFFRSQPTDDYADIGTLETPGGGYTGTNKWLVISTSRRKLSEGLYSKEKTFLYSAKGWNTTIYS